MGSIFLDRNVVPGSTKYVFFFNKIRVGAGQLWPDRNRSSKVLLPLSRTLKPDLA